ncbi:MAG: hypothetical protein IJH12_10300 [Clostridia bacterium]|nr:hypothetical protein [Clostridia bacterium]
MSNKAVTIIISIFIILFAINCVWCISDLCNTKDVYNLKISQAEELDAIKKINNPIKLDVKIATSLNENENKTMSKIF